MHLCPTLGCITSGLHLSVFQFGHPPPSPATHFPPPPGGDLQEKMGTASCGEEEAGDCPGPRKETGLHVTQGSWEMGSQVPPLPPRNPLMPDCGVHYLWSAFVCFSISPPPPPPRDIHVAGCGEHLPAWGLCVDRIPGTDQAVRGGPHGQKLHSGVPPRQRDACGSANARSSADGRLS